MPIGPHRRTSRDQNFSSRRLRAAVTNKPDTLSGDDQLLGENHQPQRIEFVVHQFRKASPVWIVEELLRGAQPGTVPFDYKFYMFQGQIAMVAQIDRNSSPPRMVKLDGDLKPLVPGRDYRFAPKDLQPGVPVVPRTAVMLSRWAIELSLMTDSPTAAAWVGTDWLIRRIGCWRVVGTNRSMTTFSRRIWRPHGRPGSAVDLHCHRSGRPRGRSTRRSPRGNPTTPPGRGASHGSMTHEAQSNHGCGNRGTYSHCVHWNQ